MILSVHSSVRSRAWSSSTPSTLELWLAWSCVGLVQVTTAAESRPEDSISQQSSAWGQNQKSEWARQGQTHEIQRLQVCPVKHHEHQWMTVREDKGRAESRRSLPESLESREHVRRTEWERSWMVSWDEPKGTCFLLLPQIRFYFYLNYLYLFFILWI